MASSGAWKDAQRDAASRRTTWRDSHIETLSPNSSFATRSGLEGAWVREAAESGSVDRLKVVLSKYSGSIDSATRSGVTAIHKAAENGHHEVIRFLCERHSNPNIATKSSLERPLHLAAHKNYHECCRVLIAGFDVLW